MRTRLFLNTCVGSCESVTQRIIVCSVNPSEGVRTVKNSILHWLWHKFVPAAHRAPTHGEIASPKPGKLTLRVC